MNMKNIFVMLIGIFLFVACSTNSGEKSGNVYTISYDSNSKEVSYSLEKEKKFNDIIYQFVYEDNNKKIYACSKNKIYKLNSNFNIEDSTGGTGKAPGEYTFIKGLTLYAPYLVVFDLMGTFNLYDLDLKLLKTKRTAFALNQLFSTYIKLYQHKFYIAFSNMRTFDSQFGIYPFSKENIFGKKEKMLTTKKLHNSSHTMHQKLMEAAGKLAVTENEIITYFRHGTMLKVYNKNGILTKVIELEKIFDKLGILGHSDLDHMTNYVVYKNHKFYVLVSSKHSKEDSYKDKHFILVIDDIENKLRNIIPLNNRVTVFTLLNDSNDELILLSFKNDITFFQKIKLSDGI